MQRGDTETATAQTGERAAVGSAGERLIAAMRAALALSALLVVYVDPAEPSRFVPATYAALVVYAAYSAFLYTSMVRHGAPGAALGRWTPWVDVGCATALVGLSDGTNSILFLFYFFAVLSASFLHGFGSGFRVTCASTVLFVAISYASHADATQLEVNRFLMRSIALLAIGGLMAYWGEQDLQHKRRLAMLGAVTTLSSLSPGFDRAIDAILERTRSFFGAKRCLQITAEPDTGEYRMRVATDAGLHATIRVDTVPRELARVFLTLPAGHAVLYEAPGRWRRRPRYLAFDAASGSRTGGGLEACETLADSLEAESFISVPVRRQGKSVGRLFLTARAGSFADSDVEFLAQLVDHVAPVVENIRLVDRLASEAAEQERLRIARDLHDGVIQPYIGLGLGLAALRQKIVRGDGVAAEDVDRLTRLTEEAITGLRRSTRELRSAGGLDGALVPAVRRSAARFSESTGIEVTVEAEDGLAVAERVADEAFQIVGEGLSNVRRHTRGLPVTVGIERANGRITITVANRNGADGPPPPFVPRSIYERVAALGGETRVDTDAAGETRVTARIPVREEGI